VESRSQSGWSFLSVNRPWERGIVVTEQQHFQEKQWSMIVARAWADEGFKERLLSEPKAVLREHGLEMAPEIDVKIVEDSERVRHFVLPANPVGELTEEELSPTAGADSFSGFSGGCGRCGRCGCGCDAF
jgi:hypothetical protein